MSRSDPTRHAPFHWDDPLLLNEQLNEDERMVRDAEEHASEDKKRRESAETRNSAEQLAYSTEKLIKDNDDKLPADVKSDVQGDVDALKTALAGDDDDAVKNAFDKLSQSQGKLGEAIYAQGQTADADPAQSVDACEVLTGGTRAACPLMATESHPFIVARPMQTSVGMFVAVTVNCEVLPVTVIVPFRL